MVLTVSNNAPHKIVILCSFLTSIYLSLSLFFLFFTEKIYHIDVFYYSVIIVALSGMEGLKFFFIYILNDNSVLREKSTKTKKYLKVKIKEIFKSLNVFVGAAGLFYVLAVLFGAPILTDYEKTLMFAALVSTLTILPACLNLGAENTVALITGAKVNSNLGATILKNIQLTLLGAWLGAVVIPLDWERPWQVWPIPSCTGAVVGSILSHSIIVLKGIPSIIKYKLFK